MKFQQFNTKSIFEPERLSDLSAELYAGVPVKQAKRLSLDDLAKVPEIYGTLEFGKAGFDVRELDSEGEYVTSNKNVILGKDIKALTMLMYDKPRTAYVDFGNTSQVHQAGASGAVPLPMLGYKRFKNISYNKWRTIFINSMKSSIEFKGDTRKPRWVIKGNDLEKAWKLDMMLGKTLASTHFDTVSGEIQWNKKLGLVQISTLTGKITPDAKTVRFLREAGFGNHRGNMATAWGTATIASIPDGVDKDIVNLFNISDTPVRLMLSQRWCWYGMHRSSDMICGITDWDEMPENIDHMSTGMKGLEPKTTNDVPTGNSLAKAFGL